MPWCYSLLFMICLFERVTKRVEEKKRIFHPLVQSADCCKSFICSPALVQGPSIWTILCYFPMHIVRELDVQQPGFDLTSIQNTSTTGRGFTHYATVLALENFFSLVVAGDPRLIAVLFESLGLFPHGYLSLCFYLSVWI